MTMPWEKPASDGLDIPPMLKRDANNRAPFMDLCVDEGCPQHGMTHVCISPSTNLPVFDPSALPPWAATSPQK